MYLQPSIPNRDLVQPLGWDGLARQVEGIDQTVLIRLVPNASFSPRRFGVVSTHLGSNRIRMDQTNDLALARSHLGLLEGFNDLRQLDGWGIAMSGGLKSWARR